MRTAKIIFLIFIFRNAAVLCQELIYSISPLAFNTRDYDEFSAIPFKDGLVYCSNRPEKLLYRSNTDGFPMLDLYFIRKENQNWTAPEKFSNQINSNFNEGPFSFSSNGNTIYFTRGSQDSEGIFVSSSNGSVWNLPVPFQFNEKGGITAQPFLSEDGEKLFFAAVRKEGLGGFDLYVCNRLKNNQWTIPKNLGPDINSVYDEKYPFYLKDGKLYFASNRKDGIGGFDIYFSNETDGRWTKPALLSPPVNSPWNEIAFTSDSLDSHGFFSSDRNGRQLFDVYEYNLKTPLLDTKNLKPQSKNKYTYIFTENSAFNQDTTSFLYEWDFGDGQKVKGRELEVEHSFKKPGDYLVQLNVIDTITGQVFLNQASSIFPVRDIEQPYIECPDTANFNEPVLLNGGKTYLPGKEIMNYYWIFSDGYYETGEQVKYVFTQPGKNKIILSVTYKNKDGQVQTEARYKEIVILGKP